MPLSQTETGALATAPLSAVINSATDALYQDLYDLVQGEITIESVTSASNPAAAAGRGGVADGDDGMGSESHAAGKLSAAMGVNKYGDTSATTVAPAITTTTTSTAAAKSSNDVILETRKMRMANLSFAQRRHELTRRIVQHSKSLAHVYALTAASLPKSHSAVMQQKASRTSATAHSSHPTTPTTAATTMSNVKIHDPSLRLGAMVEASSDALQFVKSRWVSQDEAQDALYFHHDSLWKARAHCHDVLGALCVLSTPGGGGEGGGSGGGGGGDGPTSPRTWHLPWTGMPHPKKERTPRRNCKLDWHRPFDESWC